MSETFKRKRAYVGIYGRDPTFREVFTSRTTPTPESHPRYAGTIGPFKTYAGARFMANHGYDNPHCRCVRDAERLAKAQAKAAKATAMTIERDRKLASGEEITLAFDGKQYEVTCWTVGGENHWTKQFKTFEEAEIEYNRFD